MTPVAGSSTSFGIDTMMSGLPIVHPSLNTTGAGLSFGLPSTAPFSAHAAIVAISSALSTFAFSKCPIDGSANHGGIVRAVTAFAIARAYGLVSWNDRNDIGAIAPGR